MLANGEYGDAFVDSRHLWTLWKFHVQMQCTRASPHRDSGTMSGLENSTELFNDLRSQQFLPEIITSFHHDSCPERDSDKNGGTKCTLHRPGKKRRKQKTHAVVGFTGGKKHHFLVEMVPQQKSRKDGKLLYYWDLLRFIGFRQASVSSWHSGYRGMLPWPCPPWWQTGAQDTNRRKSLSSYKIRSRKNSRNKRSLRSLRSLPVNLLQSNLLLPRLSPDPMPGNVQNQM